MESANYYYDGCKSKVMVLILRTMMIGWYRREERAGDLILQTSGFSNVC
jgi:hypothetical protein